MPHNDRMDNDTVNLVCCAICKPAMNVDPLDQQRRVKMRYKTVTVLRTILFLVTIVPILVSSAQAQTSKPNILVIWGDDIG